MKEIRVKNNSQDWFDAEIHEEIEMRDKLLAKFKTSRKSTDHENYKKARNKVQYLINDKKKTFVVGKLHENIGKPKELWKPLKSLGLPTKKASPSMICLEKDGTLSFDSKTNAQIFRGFYSNLASDLLKSSDMSPEYTLEVFCPSYRRHNTHPSMLMLYVPFPKYCSGQKTLSFLGPRTWYTLPAQINCIGA